MTTLLFDSPGPRTRRRIRIWSVVIGLAAAAVLLMTAVALNAAGQFDGALWSVVLNPELLTLLLDGALATGLVAAVALLFSLLFGVAIAAGLLSRLRWLQWALRAWVEVFRGLPLLLLIFFLYLGGPAFGFDISTFWSLAGALVLYNSAVIAEIIRAGVLALPAGQAEAAYAIGMRRTETLLVIQLPQAVRLMLPALVSQIVALLKETSLGFIIGYTELLRDGRTAIEFLGGEYSLPIYTMLALMYILANLALSAIARRLEAHQRRPGTTVPAALLGTAVLVD